MSESSPAEVREVQSEQDYTTEVCGVTIGNSSIDKFVIMSA
jgi:hypothetical protein